MAQLRGILLDETIRGLRFSRVNFLFKTPDGSVVRTDDGAHVLKSRQVWSRSRGIWKKKDDTYLIPFQDRKYVFLREGDPRPLALSKLLVREVEAVESVESTEGEPEGEGDDETVKKPERTVVKAWLGPAPYDSEVFDRAISSHIPRLLMKKRIDWRDYIPLILIVVGAVVVMAVISISLR